MTTRIDGKGFARRLNAELGTQVESMDKKPGLGVILVGADPASQVYVRLKGRAAERIGIHHIQIDLSAESTQEEVLAAVDRLNADDAIDGILVQLPLPKHLDEDAVIDRIDPAKDVDGLSTWNAGRLAQGRPNLVACTPQGCMRLLEEYSVETSGKSAVVIGRSNIVGRPMAQLLEQANATVTVVHSRTPNAKELCHAADILVVAVGRPLMVDASWIKPGATVIDVGINRLDTGKLVGDVDGASLEGVAGAYTPVPGGVGPMTIAMLMQNTVRAAQMRQG